MLASKNSPAALIAFYYLEPSPDGASLVGRDLHYLARWQQTWHWIAGDLDNEVQHSSDSLREVAATMASKVEPFEYAHIHLITGTIGFEEETPWEIFPLEQVLEEVGRLFEQTPEFSMEFGSRKFRVVPLVWFSPRHLIDGCGDSQTHLLYIPMELGSGPLDMIFCNFSKDDGDLDSDRWDKVEAAFFCGNEVVTIQSYRGTAQHCSDTRGFADRDRAGALSLEVVREFIGMATRSLEREPDTFVDLWGHAIVMTTGEQILTNLQN